MTKKTPEVKKCECETKIKGGAPEGIYGLAFLGALFYFIQNATNLTEGLIGVLKAIFWPAYLIYKILMFISA